MKRHLRPHCAPNTAIAVFVTAGLALLVLGPTLPPGYLLLRDMVFTPDPPFTVRLLGIDTALPRAVPSDLLVALTSAVFGGAVAQRLILLAILAGAGIGAGRLYAALDPCVRPMPATGRTRVPAILGVAASCVTFMWNPLVAERLLIGQWAYLIGFAALPWVALAALRLGDSDRVGGGIGALAAALGLGALGGAPAWTVVALVAVPVAVLAPPTRFSRTVRGTVTGALVALVALPWLVPSLTRPGGAGSDSAGAAVFALRPDTPLGAVLSALSGGGIWNAEAVPPGRDTVVAGLAATALAVVAVAGIWSRRRAPGVSALLVAALVGLLLAVAADWTASRELVAAMPGGGLLRDSHRLLGPWVLALALGSGRAVEWIARRAGSGLAAVLVMAPIAVLPTLAWGIDGALTPVAYPSDYRTVSRLLDDDPRPGAVAVLPFSTYRRFGWNPVGPVTQPLPRWLSRRVISSIDLPVRTGTGRVVTIAGEDALAAATGRVVADAHTGAQLSAGLGALGIRWVVVDAALPGSFPVARLSALSPRYDGVDLRVYEIDDVDDRAARMPQRGLTPPAGLVIGVDAGVSVILAGVALACGYLRVRRMLGFGQLSRKRGEGSRSD